jgi:hypothetical protein
MSSEAAGTESGRASSMGPQAQGVWWYRRIPQSLRSGSGCIWPRGRGTLRRARTPSRISRGEGTAGRQGQARIAATMCSSRPRRPYAQICSSPKDQRGIQAQGGRHSEQRQRRCAQRGGSSGGGPGGGGGGAAAAATARPAMRY